MGGRAKNNDWHEKMKVPRIIEKEVKEVKENLRNNQQRKEIDIKKKVNSFWKKVPQRLNREEWKRKFKEMG